MPAKRSRDLSTTCGLLIEAAGFLQRGMHDDVERATGLSGAWLEVLLRLHRTPGGAMRINEIAAQVTLPASSFSRLADRMEDEGLVERHPDPRHRRATLLHVTSAGEQRFAEAWKVLEPSQQSAWANCSAELSSTCWRRSLASYATPTGLLLFASTDSRFSLEEGIRDAEL